MHHIAGLKSRIWGSCWSCYSKWNMRSHLGNNCWVHWQKLLFTHVLSKAKIPASVNLFLICLMKIHWESIWRLSGFNLSVRRCTTKFWGGSRRRGKHLNLSFGLLGRKPRNFGLILCMWLKSRLRGKILSNLRSFLYCPLAGWVFIIGTVFPWLVESLILTLVTFQSWSMSVNSILAELWRAKRACGAPWVSKSTHPRKFGNHVTDRPSNRPSVRTTVIPMFRE